MLVLVDWLWGFMGLVNLFPLLLFFSWGFMSPVKLLPWSFFFQIRYISQTQGLPSDHLLTNGSKSLKFFKKVLSSTTGLLEWKMKVKLSYNLLIQILWFPCIWLMHVLELLLVLNVLTVFLFLLFFIFIIFYFFGFLTATKRNFLVVAILVYF